MVWEATLINDQDHAGVVCLEPDCAGLDSVDTHELCAVASPTLCKSLTQVRKSGALPVIGYPPDVFFGAVFMRRILPALTSEFRLDIRCETALVPSALSLAVEGVGAAWLPRTLCASLLSAGALVDLGPSFGSADMRIVSARLSTPRPQPAETVWTQLPVFMAELGRGSKGNAQREHRD